MLDDDRDGPVATLAESQFNQLEAYLGYPRWDEKQASMIIAGFDPELCEQMGGLRNFLPGGQRVYPKGDQTRGWSNHDGTIDWNSFELNAQDELDSVKEFISGTPRHPLKWIQLALDADYRPCWMDRAFADPELRQVLFALRTSDNPPNLFSTDLAQPSSNTILPDAKFDNNASKRKGGIAKRDKDPAQKCKGFIVRDWDLALAAGLTADLPQYIKKQQDIYVQGPAPASASSIKRWISALSKEVGSRSPLVWADDLRAKNRVTATQEGI